MGQQHSWLSAKEVIGEPPEKTSDCVTDPEDGVDQHWLVVFLTHPIVLAGDGVEDIAVVKVPALVAQLVGTSLHQADHVVPDGCELVWICVLHLERGEVRGREVPKLCIDCVCVEHGAGTGVARLPWDPGKNFFPRSSCPSLLKVYHLVRATMGRRVEDEHLSVEVKSTQEGGVEDEDSTEKFLVEPEVTDLDQDVVVGHRERFFSKTRQR